MNRAAEHDVVVYHDESSHFAGRKYRAHALLFVPSKLSVRDTTPLFGTTITNHSPSQALLHEILNIRQRYGLSQSCILRT